MTLLERLPAIVSVTAHILYGFDIMGIAAAIHFPEKIKKVSLLLLVPYGALSCLFYFDGLPLKVRILTFAAMYAVLFLAIILVCKKDKMKAIYCSVMFLMSDSLLSSLTALLLKLFGVRDDSMLPAKIVSLVFDAAFLLVLLKMRRRQKISLATYIGSLPRGIAAVALALVFLLSLLSAFVSAVFIPSSVRAPMIIILVIFLIILSCLTVIYMLKMFFSAMQYKQTSEILSGQMLSQAEYYKKSGLMANEIRSFRHDYKNHLQCLNALLKKNKTDEAVEYLHAMIEGSPFRTDTIKSGNDFADAILNSKAALAAEQGCTLDHSGVISEDIPILSLCTILFNAIDNAVEACCRYEGEAEKRISIHCGVRGGVQMITVTNPCGTVAETGSTSKPDKKNHGFGMRNMKRAVRELDGSLSAEAKGGVFRLEVDFRIPDQI
ncbi:MAG: GHKL domain-containing protein [Ruminococcus sp.]|nr:GHKL domain-containing protein [Ruminococcus sp.]